MSAPAADEREAIAGDVPATLAAIDIGTNSIHLVVARVADGGQFEVLAREKDMVRLGSSGGDMKELEPEAIERAVAALDRFRLIAESFGAAITAVATSAVREAENELEFIRRVPGTGQTLRASPFR